MKTLYRLLKVVHSLSSKVASKCCKCFCCLINMFGARWCIIHLTPLTKFGYTIYFILNICMKFSVCIFQRKKEKIILAWEYFFGQAKIILDRLIRWKYFCIESLYHIAFVILLDIGNPSIIDKSSSEWIESKLRITRQYNIEFREWYKEIGWYLHMRNTEKDSSSIRTLWRCKACKV